MPEDDFSEEEEEEVVDEPPNPKKRKRTKTVPKVRTWKQEDITNDPLPAFHHPAPSCIRSPYEYFEDMFPLDLVDDIVYQTNLYARQRDVNTSFSIDRHEFMVFLGIVIYMGVICAPSIEDYWGTLTRVSQVADVMSSKRFRLIRSILHFNNNEHARASTDRFYKVRPLFNAITRQFQRIRETPAQSVDEVMVAYKGTRAGNLRQYIKSKPDRWGYKLFCRSSIDGFIHDILMYQGESTFSSHATELSEEESQLPVSTRTVICLAKTIKNPSQSSIYADNYFTSLTLVEFLRDKFGCRYVGTAQLNRIGRPPLMDDKTMNKAARGTSDFCASDGILALRWKDNKIVTILSTDVGINPTDEMKRYSRDAKMKVDIGCPKVIKEYNGKMGGIDKSDMLTHLYKTPMRARRWYMRLFGYVVDLCLCNAWLLYKRDCVALKEKPMTLKTFRLDISRFARCHNTMAANRVTRQSTDNPLLPAVLQRGQRAVMPATALRYDNKGGHFPEFSPTRQSCKHCSKKGDIHRSRWVCVKCKVALCLSDTRNCFGPFHTPPE